MRRKDMDRQLDEFSAIVTEATAALSRGTQAAKAEIAGAAAEAIARVRGAAHPIVEAQEQELVPEVRDALVQAVAVTVDGLFGMIAQAFVERGMSLDQDALLATFAAPLAAALLALPAAQRAAAGRVAAVAILARVVHLQQLGREALAQVTPAAGEAH